MKSGKPSENGKEELRKISKPKQNEQEKFKLKNCS
jgi:hypothetical protein